MFWTSEKSEASAASVFQHSALTPNISKIYQSHQNCRAAISSGKKCSVRHTSGCTLINGPLQHLAVQWKNIASFHDLETRSKQGIVHYTSQFSIVKNNEKQLKYYSNQKYIYSCGDNTWNGSELWKNLKTIRSHPWKFWKQQHGNFFPDRLASTFSKRQPSLISKAASFLAASRRVSSCFWDFGTLGLTCSAWFCFENCRVWDWPPPSLLLPFPGAVESPVMISHANAKLRCTAAVALGTQ